MARRNLQREARHLMPKATPADIVAGQQALRLRVAVCEAMPDPTVDAAEARRAGIRLVFDQLVEKARQYWIGGVPTIYDLRAVELRVSRLLGLSADEVTEALTGHPRPATAG